jgi:hypothetical protein
MKARFLASVLALAAGAGGLAIAVLLVVHQ